jgi:EamA domain-containing membrane protein RarD
MKTRRTIYFCIGGFLILLNILADILSLREFFAKAESLDYSIGYFIGYHILMIFGIVLFREGLKLNKKIKLSEGFDADASIENIGKP